MNRTDYLTRINAEGINTLGVEWQTEVKPAAAHRARLLGKISSAVVMTGVGFKTLAVNAGRTTGDLPWGEWAEYPFVVTHKGTLYVRLYTVDDTVRTLYFVDGALAHRDDFLSYLTPSQRVTTRPIGGTITVKLSNVREVGDPSLALRR
jgi:hypothetical protein